MFVLQMRFSVVIIEFACHCVRLLKIVRFVLIFNRFLHCLILKWNQAVLNNDSFGFHKIDYH